MHCLNLKLTYNCTNHCSFCFSSRLSGNEITLEGLKRAVEVGYKSGCREIVISGGEPTLVPGFIKEILELAERLGYEKYILQTNGSGIASNSKLLSYLDSIAIKKDFFISFSIQGHSANLHNSISGSEGAFEKLILAMEEVKKSHCKIYTNTVVSKLNISNLKEIALLLLTYKPVIMQFSMMHLTHPSDICTTLIETSIAIRKLKDIVPSTTLKTEGIPFCLMHGMEYCVGESFWPNKLDLYNYEDHYMHEFTQLGSGMRAKKEFCNRCIMNEICMGVWREHISELEKLNIQPIR